MIRHNKFMGFGLLILILSIGFCLYSGPFLLIGCGLACLAAIRRRFSARNPEVSAPQSERMRSTGTGGSVCLRKAGILVFVCMVLAGPGRNALADQSFDTINVVPNAIQVQTPTKVLVTAQLADDPKLIRTSVNLIQCDATGKALKTLATFINDGPQLSLDGFFDSYNESHTINDKIFSAMVTLTEPAVGTVYLRASAAYKGRLLRVLSPIVQVAVESQVDQPPVVVYFNGPWSGPPCSPFIFRAFAFSPYGWNLTYTWDIGLGWSDPGIPITLWDGVGSGIGWGDYYVPGTYNVVLTVDDRHGRVTNVDSTTTITPKAPVPTQAYYSDTCDGTITVEFSCAVQFISPYTDCDTYFTNSLAGCSVTMDPSGLMVVLSNAPLNVFRLTLANSIAAAGDPKLIVEGTVDVSNPCFGLPE
jgi:hypothetical protein